MRLLPSFPSEEFVITTLKVLTKLAAQTLVDIPEQVRTEHMCVLLFSWA